MHLLSKEQKSKICQLAREVWELRGDLRGPLLEANLGRMSKTAIFQAWRHVEQGQAVGRQSLTKCTSEEHYLPLTAHFLDLKGDKVGAAKARARHEQEPKLRAMHHLRKECARRGVDIAFAAEIFFDMSRKTRRLDEAGEHEIYGLIRTVKNRRKIARPAGAKSENPF